MKGKGENDITPFYAGYLARIPHPTISKSVRQKAFSTTLPPSIPRFILQTITVVVKIKGVKREVVAATYMSLLATSLGNKASKVSRRQDNRTCPAAAASQKAPGSEYVYTYFTSNLKGIPSTASVSLLMLSHYAGLVESRLGTSDNTRLRQGCRKKEQRGVVTSNEQNR